MKNNYVFALLVAIVISFSATAQESNIRTYTPSKLLKQGQWDVKWFNNFYSETENPFRNNNDRENYFTSTFEIFRGFSENSRLNFGLVFNVKSNNIGDKSWFSPLELKNETGVSRVGLTSIAPSVSFQPFKNIGNFSIRSSIFIPLVANETENNVFLDKNSFVWDTKFFYDYTLPSGDFQIFTEIDTQLNFGDKEEGFANNSLGLPVSAFLSYFPTNKSTIYFQAQQYFLIDLGNDFGQEFTQLGIGAKYQISSKINLETSYTNFVRGSDSGLGETINFGLRFLSN
ncbi:hypothetical protein [Flavicella sediminum]|uniref:hypothetical protein n=1 Tax=Flavicella sediminum TaxID=2585141 RepID=UPI0011211E89|nr:hypothetical protein [Flavicella sediminum]